LLSCNCNNINYLQGKNMNASKFVKKLSVAAVAVGALTLGMSQAMADQIFDFTFSGPTASGFGTLHTTDNGDGSFTAISGSGTETVGTTTDTLTLIFNSAGTARNSSPSTVFNFDNQLFPSANPFISNGGLLFSSSTQEVNLFSNGPGSYQFGQQNRFNEATTFTLTAVPEPTTFALLSLGLLGFAVSRRKAANSKNA
jgi:hypothetical protein